MILTYIRCAVRRDLALMLAIESESFSQEGMWTEDDFMTALRQKNTIAYVAEFDGQVVGFIVFELHRDRLHILNIAVNQKFRRRRVGTQLIQQLVKKLSPVMRKEIRLDVRETNLPAQQFFRARGFKATKVLKGFYAEELGVDEDAYQMQYWLDSREPALA